MGNKIILPCSRLIVLYFLISDLNLPYTVPVPVLVTIISNTYGRYQGNCMATKVSLLNCDLFLHDDLNSTICSKPKLHIVLAASCMSQIYLKFDRSLQHGKSRDLIIMNLLISFHDYKLLTTSLVIWMQYIFVRYSIFLILKNPHDYIYTTDKLLIRNYGKSSYNKGHHEGI